jgi:pimeloyl-ACP methyl ester carboxylesterase
MTTHRIERGFLTLPGRQVHYRRAGSGPPVVLLHQSPKSSEELVPLILLLAENFTVLAPDTPGYGLSDPIVSPDADIEIDVFADAVAEFFDGMGLEHAGLYGLHTGAAIATRFTARYPERVLALVANGTLIKAPEERADLLAHYLPRFAPSWDGSHLAWAWARMREQLIFFPWHKRDPLARVAIPMTLESLQINTLALLQAGDNYRTAYRTAFSYAVEDDLPHIQPPARFICAESDVLVRYLERFPPLPPSAEITRVAAPGEAFQVTQAFFREMVQGETHARVTTARRAFRLTSSMISLSGGQLHVRENLDGAGRPVMILHDIGGSSRALDAIAGGFIGRRPVFAPDLAGHGDSDPVPAGDDALIDRLAAALAGLIAQRGLSGVDLIAVGDSAAIALALVECVPAAISSLSLCNPTAVPSERIAEFAREAVPALSPDWGGGHLLTAWHRARDQDLFWPWFDKSGGATLDHGLPASEAIVQQRVIDLFKSEAIHSELNKAIVNDRLVDRIGRCAIPPMLFRSPDRPVCEAITALLSPTMLGMSQAAWAQRILDAIARAS